ASPSSLTVNKYSSTSSSRTAATALKPPPPQAIHQPEQTSPLIKSSAVPQSSTVSISALPNPRSPPTRSSALSLQSCEGRSQTSSMNRASSASPSPSSEASTTCSATSPLQLAKSKQPKTTLPRSSAPIAARSIPPSRPLES